VPKGNIPSNTPPSKERCSSSEVGDDDDGSAEAAPAAVEDEEEEEDDDEDKDDEDAEDDEEAEALIHASIQATNFAHGPTHRLSCTSHRCPKSGLPTVMVSLAQG
jgi:hypothetical protein